MEDEKHVSTYVPTYQGGNSQLPHFHKAMLDSQSQQLLFPLSLQFNSTTPPLPRTVYHLDRHINYHACAALLQLCRRIGYHERNFDPFPPHK